ncbi:hypothetical protein BCON_0059g00110 [Botryotinia convoluta]|uniref:Rhodopsin domain-containing protein n=1 Tax=Botryotinia convoluta TaxID=54673 RepID=A0A4Z1IEP1_9HELO|nr:hypothetical protein BCON_0059g00110 [Botryotinia convoluta]
MGRIHKQELFASTLALYILAITAAFIRFYIRIRIQKQFAIDDALIIVGILCITASIGLLFNYIDNLFMTEALILGTSEIYTQLPKDFIQRVYDYSERSTISLMCAWGAIVSVKFSFLFFFKKLIDRIKSMTRYWWVVFVLNLIIAGYGLAIYILACPHYNNPQVLQCGQGAKAQVVINYAVSQMVLDIFSDLIILVIPVRLIWQIKVRWSQKIALGFSLCLTIGMIVLTVIRVSGLRAESSFDSAWEVYWLIVAGEVGLILTTGTAFRALFVSRNQKVIGPQPHVDNSKIFTKTKELLRLIATPKKWRTRRISEASGAIDSASARHEMHRMIALSGIERGTITGIRTFINGRSSALRVSQVIKSPVEQEEDGWPLSEQQQSIKVQHEIWTTSERAGMQESHPPVTDRDMV